MYDLFCSWVSKINLENLLKVFVLIIIKYMYKDMFMSSVVI